MPGGGRVIRSGPSLKLQSLLLAAASVVLPACAAAESASDRFPGWLRACAGGAPRGALCGEYPVWENRQQRSGRRIALRVVVLPALTEQPAPDPVFYFMGGPGGAASDGMPGVAALLQGLRRDRDLLFVDQRGTGGSNPIDCPAPGADAPLQVYFNDFLDPEEVRRCLELQEADVGQYTTPIAMDDIDEVRSAIGYRRINLYGGSYGTRAAQVYLRRHPETVRAAVLKGVAPMNMRNPLPFAKALEAAVARLVADCAADSSCGAAFPDLGKAWGRIRDRFEAGPVSAGVEDPASGRSEQVTISRGVFADGVRHILYTVAGSRDLPGILAAAAEGDFRPFAQRELAQARGYAKMLSIGMFLTVICSEDVRFVSEEDIVRETAGTFLGDYRLRQQQRACELWGAGEGVDDSYPEPVKVDVPVLLISGELDTATPPAGAETVARHLPRSLHLVVPNQSHGFANFACERRIIVDFLRSADLEGLDTECVAATRRPPFAASQ